MTITQSPPTPEPAGPIFEPVTSGEALSREFLAFLAQLGRLSPEEIAIRAGWTLGIIAAAFAMLWLLRFGLRLAARWLSPKQDKDAVAGKAARRNVGAWTMGAARFVIAMFAVGTILFIWGFDVRTGALGQVLGALWRAGLIIMIALAAIEVCGYAITRLMHHSARRSIDVRRAAQMRTLAPVLKTISTGLVGIIALMMVLSEIGLDIGPLIAGAGIIGIAIGFGAQSLVKDFLTGVFLIVEDIVSVGDVVRIGDSGGSVEAMTLRTIRLRDFDGTLHIFPYGEAAVIHNLTKTFSFYALNLSVSYTADINRAIEVMQEVGEEMRTEKPYSDAILEPIEVVGVDALADTAIKIKARIKTKPGQQWGVGREYLKRIKFAFDANGIEIAAPRMKLIAPEQPMLPMEIPPSATNAAE